MEKEIEMLRARNAELEARVKNLELEEQEYFVKWLKEKNARIAVLEAALKPFSYFDVFDLKFADFPDDCIITGLSKRLGDLRAARAAMEGKND